MLAGQKGMASKRNYKGYDYNPYNHNNQKKGIRLKKDKIVIVSCFLVIIFQVALAIGVIGHYNQITRMNKEIVLHERKLAEINQEQEHLKLEIVSLSTLKRIEGIAVKELGMHHPWEEREPNLVATTH